MARPPFEFCVVDEAQDIGVAELRFLSALGAGRPDALFFAGDLGQRIFQTPFSWRALGVDIRGRSHTLRVNYRTSHQIRRQADRLLPPETSDVDGNTDRRTGTVSVFNGAEPVIQVLSSHDAETAAIAEWLKSRGQEGWHPARDGRVRPIEGRTGQSHRGGCNGRLFRGRSGAARRRRHGQRHSRHDAPRQGSGSFAPWSSPPAMTRRLPSQARIERVGDQAELDEVYTTERHPALRRLHACPRSSPGDRRRTGLRVPRRPARRALTARPYRERESYGAAQRHAE